jgi:TonB-dependent receptor
MLLPLTLVHINERNCPMEYSCELNDFVPNQGGDPPVFRGLVAVLVLLLLAAPLAVHGQSTGAIEARVVDQARDPLSGANIVIQDLAVGAATDSEGVARITGIEAGKYELEISFIGYENKTRSVRVVAGETTNIRVTLSPLVLGGEGVIVTGSRNARARSVQEKRDALNIKEVQLADQVGQLPDRNLADAVGRLSGVHVQQGKGEGQFAIIRGIDPKLNKVTVNGATSALSDVAGRSGRRGPLDVIGAGNFARIEVSKTLLPDMDAQGLGGQINVETPSPLAQGNTFGYVDADIGGYDTNDRREGGVNFGYGDVFYDNELGIFLGGSFSARDFAFEGVDAEWDETDGTLRPDELTLNNNIETRQRWNLTGNVEYRLTNQTKTYVTATWNMITLEEDRPEFEAFEADENVRFSSPDRRSGTLTAESAAIERRLRDTDRQILNLTSGISQIFGSDNEFEVTAEFTYSNADEERSTRRIEFDQRDSDGSPDQIENATFDTSERLFDINVPGSNEASNFFFNKTRIETGLQNEDIYEPRIDFSWDISSQFAFKTGGKITFRDRVVDETSNRWTLTEDLNLSGLDRPGNSGFRGGRYNFSPLLNERMFQEYRRNNPDQLQFLGVSSATNSREDDYSADENIYAGYGMLSYQLDRLTAVGGVRVEHTAAEVSAFEAIFDEGPGGGFQEFINRVESNDYTSVFPSLQVQFNITDQLLARGAVSSSMGRPSFTELAPISEFEFEQTGTASDGTPVFKGGLEEGNPELDPWYANNFDVTLEYYFGEGGLVSAAVFHKEVRNPIFPIERTVENTERRGRTFEELDIERFENADDGQITGLEVTYQQQYTFLPGALSGLGVALSGSMVDSEIDIGFREENPTFPGQSDFIFSGQLFYEKAPFEARLALQHSEGYFIEFGGEDAFADEFEDQRTTLDAKVTYRVLPNTLVFLEAKNVTGTNRQQFQGSPGHLLKDEEFGPSYSIGASWNY